MSKMTFCFFSALVFFSCDNIKKESVTGIVSQADTLELLKEKIINYGDTIAYNKLSLYHTFKLTPWPILYYSQIMCNKYGYAFGCYDCYMINCEKYNPENLRSKDSLSYIFGIYYLLKANEMGYRDAKDDLEKIFVTGNFPKSTEYLKAHL